MTKSKVILLFASILFAFGFELAAQEPPDSAALLARAQGQQRDFERYRESRLRPAYEEAPRRCDDLVGRLCLFHGDEDEEAVPPEPPEVGLARRELLRVLADVAGEIPGDRWVLGQRIYYLVEVGRWRDAQRLLESCRSDPWWCDALRGYLSQRRGDHLAAAESFREAFGAMPPDVRERFQKIRPLLDRDGQELWDELPEEERNAFQETLWLLSDPLYLVEGNDRLVEHWTRVTGVLIREGAEQPYDLPWGEDLEELLLRYGQETGWERTRSLAGEIRGRDTRSVVGHHDSRGRQFIPPTGVLEEPIPTPIDAWVLEESAPFTGYTPPYAPEVGTLEAQVGRFRRGDSLLVVAAYRPFRPPEAPAERVDTQESGDSDPFGALTLPGVEPEAEPPAAGSADVESGIFLALPGRGVWGEERGSAREGVWSLAVPSGAYILSLEVFGADDRSAWRARGGLTQDTLAAGLAAISDVLILEGGEPLPETLEESLPRILPSTRLRQDQGIAVAWEVYGLRPNESARITVGFTRHREGVLRRLGEFLRVVETDEPIVIRFEDAAPNRLGTVFRAIDVQLPELDPGEYEIHVEVRLQGRDPLVSTRRLSVAQEAG